MCQGQIHLCPEFSAESLCWKYLKWPKTWFTPQQTESRNTAVFVPRWPIHSVLIWYRNTESKHSLNHHSDCKQNKAIRGNWCEFRETLNLMLPRNLHQSCPIWHWTAAPNPNQLQQTHTFHSYHTLTLLCLLWRFVLLPFLFCSCVCIHHLSPTQCPLFPAGTDGVPPPGAHSGLLSTIHSSIVGFWFCVNMLC